MAGSLTADAVQAPGRGPEVIVVHVAMLAKLDPFSYITSCSASFCPHTSYRPPGSGAVGVTVAARTFITHAARPQAAAVDTVSNLNDVGRPLWCRPASMLMAQNVTLSTQRHVTWAACAWTRLEFSDGSTLPPSPPVRVGRGQADRKAAQVLQPPKLSWNRSSGGCPSAAFDARYFLTQKLLRAVHRYPLLQVRAPTLQ